MLVSLRTTHACEPPALTCRKVTCGVATRGRKRRVCAAVPLGGIGFALLGAAEDPASPITSRLRTASWRIGMAPLPGFRAPVELNGHDQVGCRRILEQRRWRKYP